MGHKLLTEPRLRRSLQEQREWRREAHPKICHAEQCMLGSSLAVERSSRFEEITDFDWQRKESKQQKKNQLSTTAGKEESKLISKQKKRKAR